MKTSKQYYLIRGTIGPYGLRYDLAYYCENMQRNPYESAERITRHEAIKVCTENRRDDRCNGGPVGGTYVYPVSWLSECYSDVYGETYYTPSWKTDHLLCAEECSMSTEYRKAKGFLDVSGYVILDKGGRRLDSYEI